MVLLTMCQGSSDELENIDQLNGNTYILKVDRVLQNPATDITQNDILSDDQYTAASDLIEYQIQFSDNAVTISIEPVSITGKKVEHSKEANYFELVDGVFAGGRLIIRNIGTQLDAEFTVYGSGLPIAKSERGILALKK